MCAGGSESIEMEISDLLWKTFVYQVHMMNESSKYIDKNSNPQEYKTLIAKEPAQYLQDKTDNYSKLSKKD